MDSLFPDEPETASRPAQQRPAISPARRPRTKGAAEPESLPAGWVLARCDGGSRGNPGPAGFGAVVKGGDGEVLAELSEYLGVRTNNVAEYSGLLAVLAWALENGRTRLRVISDSELMVKQVQGRYKVNSPDLKPLHAEVRRRAERLDSFQISHALRHENTEADRLANEAMDRGMGKVAHPQPPATGATPVRKPVGAGTGGELDAPMPSPTGEPTALRGFVRDGVVHLLGGKKIKEGLFVKIFLE